MGLWSYSANLKWSQEPARFRAWHIAFFYNKVACCAGCGPHTARISAQEFAQAAIFFNKKEEVATKVHRPLI